jgi:ADP-heptose:LPS heptosyltransferase
MAEALVPEPVTSTRRLFLRGVTVFILATSAERFRHKEGWIVGDQRLCAMIGTCRRYETKHVLIWRSYALGDLLMLHAVVKRLRTCYPDLNFYLKTTDCYRSVFANTPVLTLSDRFQGVYDHKIRLDGVVEVDHTGAKGAQMHRAALFWRSLVDGLVPEPPLLSIDWYLPLPDRAVEWAKEWIETRGLAWKTRKRPFIGFQVRGSGPVKTLRLDEVKRFVALLIERGFDVFLIEYDSNYTWKADHVYSAPNRAKEETIALCNHFNAMVTMDSGPLWFAHVTKHPVPVVAFLGPTRISERLSLHPLFVEGGAIGIETNKEVMLHGRKGCESCFERGDRCEHSNACLQQVSAENYINSLENKLRKVISVGDSLRWR